MKLLLLVLLILNLAFLSAQECPEPFITNIYPSETHPNKVVIEFENNDYLYADLWECDILSEEEPGNHPNFGMNNVQSPYARNMHDNFFKIWIRTDCGKQINNRDNRLVSDWVGAYYYDIQEEEEEN